MIQKEGRTKGRKRKEEEEMTERTSRPKTADGSMRSYTMRVAEWDSFFLLY